MCGENDKDHSTIQVVADLEQLYSLKKASVHQSQVFIIRHENTWGRLKICRNVFEEFARQYKIFPRFWQHLLSFGWRHNENEFGFAGFQFRHFAVGRAESNNACEFSYILRRVEPNGRELSDGQSPWSIRQTAIYHKIAPGDIPDLAITSREIRPISTFLLVAPSLFAERNILRGVESAREAEEPISPWYVHWVLMTDSLRDWKDYMAWVENKLKEQTEKILLAQLSMKDRSVAQQVDGNITFLDRQHIHELEEYTIDMKMILVNMLNNIVQVRDQCQKDCLDNSTERVQTCVYFLEEFNSYVREADMYVQRAEFLSEKVRSTAQMLSTLLDYEEAKALKDLGIASQRDGKFLSALTLKSALDASAVKVLTVISLVYLPTTVVANFFSTTFVNTNNDGKTHVSTDAWILAAISVPLTFLTVVLWWLFVHLSTITVELPDNEAQPPRTLGKVKLLSWLLPWKPSRKSSDLETGIVPGGSLPDVLTEGVCTSNTKMLKH
ncbi:hypothetical protein DTO212C5_554 [Paecilomyces variotii]|nr:hypothetical protein DTO212C5_554 [Paecilomyces variotii]